LIICPACGSTVKADLCVGCPACGARAVGPPLAKAEHQLPSFGRAAIAFTSGVAVAGAFTGFLIAALAQNKSGWFEVWKIVSAGEVAAWRVKWAALPIAIAAVWTSARLARSIKINPSRFNGLRQARIGLSAAVTATLVIVTLIGVTVPERLRQRRDALEAAVSARGYALSLAMLEYRELHGTYPTDLDGLRTLPDPDGSIADALRFVDPNGYEASAQIAAAPKQKPLIPRGTALRDGKAATSADPAPLSFNAYSLKLPGEHRLFGPDDDYVLKDGVIQKASDVASTSSTNSRSRTP